MLGLFSMFESIQIEKSGRELRDICIARLNRDEFTSKLTEEQRSQLKIMSKHLTDKNRYALSLAECNFLGI